MTVDPVSFFSHTVPEATEKFAAAAADAGAPVERVVHPLRGPDGEELCASVARYGPEGARDAVLVISGTHGIEGYAGSALQIGALRTRDETLPLPPDTAVVLLHLVNPWGTAWSSRENEDNVELLRHGYYQHHEHPANPVFADFYETMGYHRATTIEEFFACRGNVRPLLEKYSPQELLSAIADGQDTHPDAITYYGGPPTWSKRLVDDVAARHLAGAERVTVLDLHTAVGGYGEAVVINNATPDTAERQRIEAWFDGDLWPSEEPLRHYRWISEVVPGRPEVTGLIIEIGTEQLGLDEQHIFPLDVWLKQHVDRMAPEYAEYVARYRRFFYPEEETWMGLGWEHGSRRLRQLMAGVASWREQDLAATERATGSGA